jgi:LAO/AO transport system kinase
MADNIFMADNIRTSRRTAGMKKLIRELLQGDRHAASRLISMVENDSALGREVVDHLKPRLGTAHIVGITGPPGSGKSTLINELTGLLRKKRRRVGVIAIDPTSPVTGGALLGDRIRMHGLFRDTGVFIRSMATRKGTGGLSPAAGYAASILDALGMDVIFIETTGVGQSEIAVKDAVHIVVVVVTPGLGDDIQLMKAGIMEIGDIFVVNKGDLTNAGRTARDLEGMIRMQPRQGERPAVVVTAASEGRGVKRLLEEIERKKSLLSQK